MMVTASKSETTSVTLSSIPQTYSLKGRKDVFHIPMEPGCKAYKVDDPEKKNDIWIHGDTIDGVSRSCKDFHNFLLNLLIRC